MTGKEHLHAKVRKQGMLKAVREKCQLTHKGKNIRIASDPLAETPKGRQAWNDIFQVTNRD
jgi:hypothetical protein